MQLQGQPPTSVEEQLFFSEANCNTITLNTSIVMLMCLINGHGWECMCCLLGNEMAGIELNNIWVLLRKANLVPQVHVPQVHVPQVHVPQVHVHQVHCMSASIVGKVVSCKTNKHAANSARVSMNSLKMDSLCESTYRKTHAPGEV